MVELGWVGLCLRGRNAWLSGPFWGLLYSVGGVEVCGVLVLYFKTGAMLRPSLYVLERRTIPSDVWDGVFVDSMALLALAEMRCIAPTESLMSRPIRI